MPTRSLCIHAHFYQPPRADPISGIIPHESGAAPYLNWNERIHAECYAPNANLGNFGHISFNLGPTLLDWMAGYDPETARKIIYQDRMNLERYGLGNALAQPYNHTILPLASYADKVTQVEWGIAEFIHHFGRYPQGMWLPETAVDTETLSVLADHHIQFTILAPWQANSENLDTTEPYRVTLPHGRSITVFFYNRELSSRISFDPNATINADGFVNHEIVRQYHPEKSARGEPQLLMMASDGELYGHHQPFRDHFLRRLVDGAASGLDIEPTYPALWLKQHPARRMVEIRERTSWSCDHGVARWKGECGCTPGAGSWKQTLRQTFDHLADSIDQLYKQAVAPYISDPWVLRNRYIQVMLREITPNELIYEMAGKTLPEDVTSRIHLLLESQRQRQLIYTSCGWFFDDFGRIEPKNSLAYAAQAVRLAQMAIGVNLAPQVILDLKRVVSQRSGLRGDAVFLRHLQRLSGRRIVGRSKPAY